MSRVELVFKRLLAGCLMLGGLASAQTTTTTGAGASGSGLERQEIRGQLRAIRYTTLSTEMGAVVQKIMLKEGDRFEEGANLVKLDCGLHEAQRSKSAAELAGAQRSLEANQRLAELNAAGLMELDLAKNAVDKAQADLKISDTQLSKCEIKAPFAGVIAEQRIREQQYVQPGTPMLDVLDDSGFEIEFLTPSTWMTRMRASMPVKIYIDELRRAHTARLIRISPRIDPVSQSIKVTASMEGSVKDLRAGMSGRIQLP